jgi:hypothetical protein
MMNVVSFKAPKFKPLPGELTPAVINGATLPVKVEAAKRAIAACCDLSELLTWKDKLAALAAAAKMARMPEMARDVNRVHKEAIFRMGEILLQYKATASSPAANPARLTPAQVAEAKDRSKKGESQVSISRDFGVNQKVVWSAINQPSYGKGYARGTKSERTAVAESVGITKRAATCATRLAAAPSDIRKAILSDDKIAANPVRMASRAPRQSYQKTAAPYSDAGMIFFRGIKRGDEAYTGNRYGFTSAATHLRSVDLSTVSKLLPEEKQRARKLVVEMQEILDDIDRRLGPDTSVES